MKATHDSPRPPRLFLALGLMILSPLCAEYLVGYDDNTGDPLALVGGLIILGPLYGAPALLIREVARRYGVRWTGMLALAAAFGILQAGVIDQSLFSESYRQIDYWNEMIQPTWIGPLGIAAYTTLEFIMGHVIWSYCAPIAIVEAMYPPLSEQPWLRRPGLVVTTILYLAAAALVLGDHLQNEQDHASQGQIAGALCVCLGLAVFAFTVGKRRRSTQVITVPRPVIFGVFTLIVAIVYSFLPPTWAGVVLAITILAVLAAIVAHFSRSPQWGGLHIIAVATGALLARAINGYFIAPLGNVPPLAKYAHNVVFLVGSALLGLWASSLYRRAKPASPSEGLDQ